jgi:cytochrome P450
MIEAIEAASLESTKKQHALLEILPSQCCALMYAGHQTTSDLLSNGMYAFLRNPNQFELLAKNPQLASRAAAEIARYDSPVHTDGRVVTRSCDFLGHTFEPGHMITLLVASANHDEEKFTQPDIFDISRQTPYRSLTFGNGPHRCVGEQFALFEVSTVFQRLSSEFPKMKLIRQDVEYKLSLKQRGVKSLPVCFF